MDIQGAEALALGGMVRTLQEAPPRRILMEFWPHGIHGMGQDPKAPIDRLVGFGYSVRALGGDGPFDVDRALRTMTVDNQEWVNLLLEHEEVVGG
jgi:hypothetical protein